MNFGDPVFSDRVSGTNAKGYTINFGYHITNVNLDTHTGKVTFSGSSTNKEISSFRAGEEYWTTYGSSSDALLHTIILQGASSLKGTTYQIPLDFERYRVPIVNNPKESCGNEEEIIYSSGANDFPANGKKGDRWYVSKGIG